MSRLQERFNVSLLNLSSKSSHRNKKWRHHLNSIAHLLGREIDFRSIFAENIVQPDSVQELIVELAGFVGEKRTEVLADLNSVYRNKTQGIEIWQLADVPHAWTFFPHKAVYGLQPRIALSGVEASFFVAQIEWEIWGIGTQYILTERKVAFLDHLGKLKALVNQSLSTSEFSSEISRLNTGIDHLSERIKANSNSK
jgi:hypothetical protein